MVILMSRHIDFESRSQNKQTTNCLLFSSMSLYLSYLSILLKRIYHKLHVVTQQIVYLKKTVDYHILLFTFRTSEVATLRVFTI